MKSTSGVSPVVVFSNVHFISFSKKLKKKRMSFRILIQGETTPILVSSLISLSLVVISFLRASDMTEMVTKDAPIHLLLVGK